MSLENHKESEVKLSEQITEERVALKLNEDYCGRCYFCSSVCPFEAIKRDSETGKLFLEIEKCQACGICYSTCPAKAFDIIYYNTDSLIRYLERAKQEYDSDTLVIMCKGSAPDSAGIERLFGIVKFIPLSVPCVGRIPGEIFLKAMDIGVKKIYVLACDENYCRFDRGSSITGYRTLAFNLLLEELGYGKEVITLKLNGLKVKADRDLCIGCGNCVFYCPYDAVKLESPGAASFDLASCKGCGLCITRCPAIALDLESWETECISTLISKLPSEMEQPKILVFRCQWAVFPTVGEESAPNIRYIDLPCAARIDTSHILEAFQRGVDGVLVVSCPEEDCKLERGSNEAQRSVVKLKERLSQIGFQDRLHFCTVSPRYPERFDREVEQFNQRIEAIYLKESKK